MNARAAGYQQVGRFGSSPHPRGYVPPRPPPRLPTGRADAKPLVIRDPQRASREADAARGMASIAPNDASGSIIHQSNHPERQRLAKGTPETPRRPWSTRNRFRGSHATFTSTQPSKAQMRNDSTGRVPLSRVGVVVVKDEPPHDAFVK
jgi:hypothetical protein